MPICYEADARLLQAFVPASPEEEVVSQEAMAPTEHHNMAHLMRHSSPKKLQSALQCGLSKPSIPQAASLQIAQVAQGTRGSLGVLAAAVPSLQPESPLGSPFSFVP